MSILHLAPDGEGTKFTVVATSLGLTEAEGHFYVTHALTASEIDRLRTMMKRKMYDLVHAEFQGQA